MGSADKYCCKSCRSALVNLIKLKGVKDKVAKAAAGRTKQAKATETATDVMQWPTKATNKLSNLDTAGWSEEEKGAFN